MTQAEIAIKVNTLVDMLINNGVDEETIKKEIDLDYYGIAFFGLEWLYDDENP